MHSCKYYDDRAQSWIREYENGHRQRTNSPVARAAPPGAPASGLVMHRDTYELRAPISPPQGTWIAQAPDGRFERLHTADYLSLSTPRVPQAPIAPQRPSATDSAGAMELMGQGSSPHRWLLTMPVSASVVARHEPVAPTLPAIEVTIDDSGTRRTVERNRERVPDPHRPGHFVTRGTMRRRGEFVPDPLRPGELVSSQVLRQREDLVEDPQQPGEMVTRRTLQRRMNFVEDPQRPGEFISRRTLQRRLDVVEDPQNPGVMITREALRQREDRVDDPRRPGHLITRKALEQRKKRHG